MFPAAVLHLSWTVKNIAVPKTIYSQILWVMSIPCIWFDECAFPFCCCRSIWKVFKCSLGVFRGKIFVENRMKVCLMANERRILLFVVKCMWVGSIGLLFYCIKNAFSGSHVRRQPEISQGFHDIYSTCLYTYICTWAYIESSVYILNV